MPIENELTFPSEYVSVFKHQGASILPLKDLQSKLYPRKILMV